MKVTGKGTFVVDGPGSSWRCRAGSPALLDAEQRPVVTALEEEADMHPMPMIFLVIGTLGVLVHAVTLTPALRDRGALTIRVRIAAMSMLAVGMLVFGVSLILVS